MGVCDEEVMSDSEKIFKFMIKITIKGGAIE